MWQLRADTPLQEEKVRFLYGLTSFEDKALLEETLNRSLATKCGSMILSASSPLSRAIRKGATWLGSS